MDLLSAASLRALAFSAGIVSFLNPCGFALIPVHITYYFKNSNLENSSLLKRLIFGMKFGLTVCLGITAVFLSLGILMNYLGKGMLKYSGWVELASGIILITIGLFYLFKLEEKFRISRVINIGEKLKSIKIKNKNLSSFLYGAGFSIASIGCALPVFLLITAGSLKLHGAFEGSLVFLMYSAGMSFFMLSLTLAIAISKEAMERISKNFLPFLYKIGPVIVVLSGIYLIYNQIFVLNLLS